MESYFLKCVKSYVNNPSSMRRENGMILESTFLGFSLARWKKNDGEKSIAKCRETKNWCLLASRSSQWEMFELMVTVNNLQFAQTHTTRFKLKVGTTTMKQAVLNSQKHDRRLFLIFEIRGTFVWPESFVESIAECLFSYNISVCK